MTGCRHASTDLESGCSTRAKRPDDRGGKDQRGEAGGKKRDRWTHQEGKRARAVSRVNLQDRPLSSPGEIESEVR